MTRIVTVLAIGLALLGGPVAAQNPFAPAATVNGDLITNFQVEQRALFLSLLRAPGSDREAAQEALIEETVRNQAARAAGITVTPEELDQGLAEFAGRANLAPDAFVAALEEAGVAAETFRDFVRNGLLWRQLVQQRFGARARPSEEEVERVLARGGAGAGVRVLLSEIALPITPETRAEVEALARRLSREIDGPAAFARAAATYSRAPTAPDGGRLDWLPLSQLSPQISGQVLGLAPGEVSDPVNLGGFIGLFLLRDLEEDGPAEPEALSIDYAEVPIPGGRSPEALAAAARLRAEVDTCDDLYGVAADRVLRSVTPVAELPADLRQELAKLDEGEVSTLLASGGNLRFVMLCGRVVEPSEGAFEAIGQQLLNQRLESYAQGYLDELRADAVIEIR
jgi:peptidyl-prolyl cis-trans isomerase SurA